MIDKNRIIPEHSLGANYLKLQCLADEQMDQISVRVIRNDLPDFLLPFRVMDVNGCTELRYTLGNQTALQYISQNMDKQQFLTLYKNLMAALMDSSDWMLDYHCFCVDMQYVFVEKDGVSVKYMYVPLESCQNSEEEILQFFKGILDSVTVEGGSDFLVKLFQAFGRGNITLKELYQMVQSELDERKTISPVKPKPVPVIEKPVTAPIVGKTEPRVLEPEIRKTEENPVFPGLHSVEESKNLKSGFFHGLGKKSEKKEEREGKKDKREKRGKKGKKDQLDDDIFQMKHDMGGQDEVVNALFGMTEKKPNQDGKKGGLFGGIRKPKPVESVQGSSEVPAENVQREENYQEAEIKNYEYTQIESDGDVTQIEDGYIQNEGDYLESVSGRISGIPERIGLDFQGERITIGRSSKDTRQPDVAFGAEHRRVGRMHACIQKENGNYYIVDLGSANATMLNRQILVPNHPYLLHDQDIIGFVVSQPIEYRVVFAANGRML